MVQIHSPRPFILITCTSFLSFHPRLRALADHNLPDFNSIASAQRSRTQSFPLQRASFAVRGAVFTHKHH